MNNMLLNVDFKTIRGKWERLAESDFEKIHLIGISDTDRLHRLAQILIERYNMPESQARSSVREFFESRGTRFDAYGKPNGWVTHDQAVADFKPIGIKPVMRRVRFTIDVNIPDPNPGKSNSFLQQVVEEANENGWEVLNMSYGGPQ